MKMNNQFWQLRFNDQWDRSKETFGEWLNGHTLHYDCNKQMWVHHTEYTEFLYPTGFPCRSYKAALRHLRNHDEIPKGTQFILVSKFVGQNRILVKK